MKIIVNTAWNHPKGINWDKMQEELTEGLKTSVPGMQIQWFEIDQTTQGSVAIFPSQEAYEENLSKLNEYRKEEIKNKGLSMVYEAVGPVKAEGKS